MKPGEVQGSQNRKRDPETGGCLFRQREHPPKMSYAFIADDCADLPVVACCRVMKVSTSGFYDYQHRQADLCRRRVEDRALTVTICAIWNQSRGTYGSLI